MSKSRVSVQAATDIMEWFLRMVADDGDMTTTVTDDGQVLRIEVVSPNGGARLVGHQGSMVNSLRKVFSGIGWRIGRRVELQVSRGKPEVNVSQAKESVYEQRAE